MAIQPPSSISTTPLTFPPTHFAKLAPRSYLHAHLSSAQTRRPSGRLPHESRKQSINTGSLTHCHGSAVVRAGDTAVVCGVRGEILSAEDVVDHRPATTNEELQRRYGGHTRLDELEEGENVKRKPRVEDAEEMAHLNLLVPNVELSTGCSPSYLPGGPPSEEAQALSHRMLSLLHTSQLLSMDDMRIWYHPTQPPSPPPPSEPSPSNPPTSMSLDLPNEPDPETTTQQQTPRVRAYWTLHITLLALSLSRPPFPTLWTALLAALRTTRLPRAWWDPDANTVLCSPTPSEAKPLTLNSLPMAMGFGVFEAGAAGGLVPSSLRAKEGEERKSWVLVDMDGFEEGVCGEEITVVVRDSVSGRGRGKGKGMEVIKIEKGGGGVLGRGEMREVVELAAGRWEEWRGMVEGS
ncbi:MAG: hypothetical protein LQ345_003547 [Seirophora villosa]|nr:MAG: hypothetical protein LQ345_003547 [Seirophora villosa]